MSTVNEVNWNFDTHRDTGEGGLFAYAVFPKPEKFECFMDVHPTINHWDVVIAAVGPMSADFREAEQIFYADMSKPLDERPDNWLEAAVQIGAIVFLGSTNASLWSENEAHYFTVTRDTLTGKGVAMMDALAAVYGEPTYVTFLDT